MIEQFENCGKCRECADDPKMAECWCGKGGHYISQERLIRIEKQKDDLLVVRLHGREV